MRVPMMTLRKWARRQMRMRIRMPWMKRIKRMMRADGERRDAARARGQRESKPWSQRRRLHWHSETQTLAMATTKMRRLVWMTEWTTYQSSQPTPPVLDLKVPSSASTSVLASCGDGAVRPACASAAAPTRAEKTDGADEIKLHSR
jgi:hypothetical protein